MKDSMTPFTTLHSSINANGNLERGEDYIVSKGGRGWGECLLAIAQLATTYLRLLKMVPVSDILAHVTTVSNPGEIVTQMMVL